VISNRPACAPSSGRRRRACRRSSSTTSIPGREPFERALLAALAEHRVEAVVLAGFMRL
jgi:folate-dependent phosphoribosylglycinamide formyltransferase PurN